MRDLPAGPAGTRLRNLTPSIVLAAPVETTDRLWIVLGAVAFGVVLYVVYRWLRTRGGETVEHLDVDALGLEDLAAPCAFVVFTTAACRPCKAALRVVNNAAHERSGFSAVTTIDAVEKADVAARYGVRTIPTVFLITASGHVVKRWLDVPDPEEVADALAEVAAA